MEALPGSSHVDLLHCPSDMTYSSTSGPSSRVSSRDTSPASSTHHPAAHPLATPSSPSAIPEVGKPLEMDHHNPFQSVQKLACDPQRSSRLAASGIARGTNNTGHNNQSGNSTVGQAAIVPVSHHTQSTNPFSPPSIPLGFSSNWQPCTASLDSLASPSSTTASSVVGSSSVSCPSSHTHTSSFANSSGGNFLASPVSPGFGNQQPVFGGSSYVSITNPPTSHSKASTFSRSFEIIDTSAATDNIATMYPTQGRVISEGDMSRAVAYCYDRGDGQFTRLVPVDSLPYALQDIPARVCSDQGMIVLPVPRSPGRNGQLANSQLVPVSNVTPSTSPNGQHDLIQSRIDRIVATSPSAGATTNGAMVLTTSSNNTNTTNRRHDTAVGYGRKPKVYCDKWIHDGTCAFTQQGCKFKHEMPQDKETQMSLGLFHGFPAWWKKLCAEQQQQQQGAAGTTALDDRPVSITSGFQGARPYGGGGGGANAALAATSWRRPEAAAAPSTPVNGGAAAGGRPPRAGMDLGRAQASRFSGLEQHMPTTPVHGNRGRGGRAANLHHSPPAIGRFVASRFGPIAPPAKKTSNMARNRAAHQQQQAGGGGCSSSSGTSSTDDGASSCGGGCGRGGGVSLKNTFAALEDFGDLRKGKGGAAAVYRGN